MRPADVKTFRRTKTVAFSRTNVLSIPKTFCLNKFNNISVDSISGITFRFTFSVSPPSFGPGHRAVWPTLLQHICLARWTHCKAKQISCKHHAQANWCPPKSRGLFAHLPPVGQKREHAAAWWLLWFLAIIFFEWLIYLFTCNSREFSFLFIVLFLVYSCFPIINDLYLN